MARYQPLIHPRKISEISDGEISLWGSSDGGTTWYPVKVTTDGEVCLDGTYLNQYAFSGYDDTTTANTVYVFKENSDGAWYILRVNTSTGAADYAAGSSGLAAAKADPAGQSYDTFANTF